MNTLVQFSALKFHVRHCWEKHKMAAIEELEAPQKELQLSPSLQHSSHIFPLFLHAEKQRVLEYFHLINCD